MAEDKNWYALIMRERKEKKIIKCIQQKNIKFYHPICTAKKDLTKKKDIVTDQPLFPGLLFIYITQWQMLEVGRIKDVLSFLHWLDKPAIISEEDISTIEKFLRSYDNVWLEKSAIDVSLRKKLLLDEASVDEHVKGGLPSLGYTIAASLVSHKIRPVIQHDGQLIIPDYLLELK